MIIKDTSLPKKVAENTQRFRSKMTALGFTISVFNFFVPLKIQLIWLFEFFLILRFQGDNHAISPVMLGDAKLASQFADLMLSNVCWFEI